jgi:hypothetical protein
MFMDGQCSLLIKSLIAEIRRGIKLIESLNDEVYTSKPGDTGSVGAHFRHNLDFGVILMAGLGSGAIDYSDRERDVRVERDRQHAMKRFEILANSLEEFDEGELDRVIRVRSEVDETLWLESSFLRELEFVHSHTVHHYALISAKLDSLGIDLPSDFGVAPSTLKFWSTQDQTKTVA